MDFFNSLIQNFGFSDFGVSDVVFIITTVLATVGTAVNNTQKKLRGNVVDLISEAEEEFKVWEKSGVLKFESVSKKLHNIIPVPLRPFFSEKAIGNIINSAFDSITQYAQTSTQKPANPSVDNSSEFIVDLTSSSPYEQYSPRCTARGNQSEQIKEYPAEPRKSDCRIKCGTTPEGEILIHLCWSDDGPQKCAEYSEEERRQE